MGEYTEIEDEVPFLRAHAQSTFYGIPAQVYCQCGTRTNSLVAESRKDSM